MLQQPARSCSSASVVHFAASTNIFQPVPSRQSFKQEVPTHAALQHGGSTITSTTMGNQYSTSSSASPWELHLLQTTTAAPPSSPTTLTMGNTASPSQQTPQISTFIEKFNFFTSFYNFLHLLHLINHYFCSPKPPYFRAKIELLQWCTWDLKNSTQLHCATGTIATPGHWGDTVKLRLHL